MRWLDRLLMLATAVVAAVSVLPLGARLYWTLELTTHFRVQYLAAAAVLLVLVALRRQWAACAVLVAAGAVSAVPVLPYVPLPFGAEPASAAAAPLKVLSINVSYRPFSARRLLEIVREADADVLVVQELTPHAESVLAALDSEFPHNRKFPANGPYGIGLWSRLRARIGSDDRDRPPAGDRSARAWAVGHVHGRRRALERARFAAPRRGAQSGAARRSRRTSRRSTGRSSSPATST